MFEGFSVWLVGLTVIVMARRSPTVLGRPRQPACVLRADALLTGAIVGVFTAQDLLLFYVFWEGMLIPLYVLIGVWGGAEPAAGDDHVRDLHDGRLAADARRRDRVRPAGRDVLDDRRRDERVELVFLGFAIAFIVKAPLFPFHGWLPDAYRESPAEVSSVLSA